MQAVATELVLANTGGINNQPATGKSNIKPGVFLNALRSKTSNIDTNTELGLDTEALPPNPDLDLAALTQPLAVAIWPEWQPKSVPKDVQLGIDAKLTGKEGGAMLIPTNINDASMTDSAVAINLIPVPEANLKVMEKPIVQLPDPLIMAFAEVTGRQPMVEVTPEEKISAANTPQSMPLLVKEVAGNDLIVPQTATVNPEPGIAVTNNPELVSPLTLPIRGEHAVQDHMSSPDQEIKTNNQPLVVEKLSINVTQPLPEPSTVITNGIPSQEGLSTTGQAAMGEPKAKPLADALAVTSGIIGTTIKNQSGSKDNPQPASLAAATITPATNSTNLVEVPPLAKEPQSTMDLSLAKVETPDTQENAVLVNRAANPLEELMSDVSSNPDSYQPETSADSAMLFKLQQTVHSRLFQKEPEVVTEDNVKNVLQRLELMVKDNLTQAKIVLKPEHLGQLTIRMELQDGVLTAKLVVESLQAKAMLEANLSSFRQQIEQNGTRVEKVEVTINQPGNDASQFFNQSQYRQPGQGSYQQYGTSWQSGYDNYGDSGHSNQPEEIPLMASKPYETSSEGFNYLV